MIVRPWVAIDHDAVCAMITSCLEETAAQGADFAPTPRSVEALWALGLGWATAGDPTLVFEDAGELLGYTLWGELASPCDLRSHTCAALGTYVVPKARRRGVSAKLRNAAFEVADARWYQRVLGSVYTKANLDAVMRVGFVPTGLLVEKRL